MKTLYKKILLVILSCSFVFIGCKKGIFSPNTKMLSNYPDEIQELYENMPVRDYSSIQVIGDGILKFQSMSHYENTCEQLKNDCELWNNLFYNQYDELDEDQIADWEEEVQFDEFLPIILFEYSLDVYGNMLYDMIRGPFLEWELNGCQGQSPTDSVFLFEWDQAVHNSYREVCIGDTIYQFRTDALILIPKEQVSDWIQIRNYPTESFAEYEFVIVKDNEADSDEAFSGSTEKVRFPCKGEGTLKSTHMECITGLDESEWKVVGRRTADCQNKLECKLINLKFDHFAYNGTPKHKRTKRFCSIAITNQNFYLDHYIGLIPSYYATYDTTIMRTLPMEQYTKRTTNSTKECLVPLLTHQFNSFHLGVMQYPELKVKIDGIEHTFTPHLDSRRH